MNSWIVAAALLGTFTAYSQTPAPPKIEATKPFAPSPAPAASPDQVKQLNDALTLYKLDQMSEQQAQRTATESDPVAKKAMEVLRNAVTSDPAVKKAHDQSEADLKALKDKITAVRKEMKLDETYDWDFNQNKFVQIKPEPGAKQAATKPNGE